MRIRNFEKSFYLSKEENKLLQDKCKKTNLNQSDCIRKIINNYEPKKYDGRIFEKHNNYIKDINLKLEAIMESLNRYGYIDKRKYDYCIDKLDFIMIDIKQSLEI